MRSHFFCLCLSFENFFFVFVSVFVFLFLKGGTKPKKNFGVLDGILEGEKTKKNCEVNRDSITPPHNTIIRVLTYQN